MEKEDPIDGFSYNILIMFNTILLPLKNFRIIVRIMPMVVPSIFDKQTCH